MGRSRPPSGASAFGEKVSEGISVCLFGISSLNGGKMLRGNKGLVMMSLYTTSGWPNRLGKVAVKRGKHMCIFPKFQK